LKEFFERLGPPHKGKMNNCARIINDNRKDDRLLWRMSVHYHRARNRAEGRMVQGGGHSPYIVSKAALKAYYDTL